jgi:hypothetical protein
LLLCSSYLPLGVPNWAVIYTPSSNFSGAIAGEKEDFYKGSDHSSLVGVLYRSLHRDQQGKKGSLFPEAKKI